MAGMMADFLAGEGWGEGIGIEVVWPSIPTEGRESRVELVAELFPGAGSLELVRLMSWEVFGIPDIPSNSSSILFLCFIL